MKTEKEKLKEKALAFIDSLDNIIEYKLNYNVYDITKLGDEHKQLKLSLDCEMQIEEVEEKIDGIVKGTD